MDTDDLKYKVYLEERASLIDAKREGTRSFDKAILTLSAGAFGLSLTFIRQITPEIKSGTLYLLVFAWGFFVLSILFTLSSFLTSQRACDEGIKILEAEFENSNSKKNRWGIVTDRLNIISIFCFIVGVILLAIFSSINLYP